MYRPNTKNSSFSLLEIMIVAVVMVPILGVTFSILNTSQNLFSFAVSKESVEAQSSKIINMIANDIEESDATTVVLHNATDSSGVIFRKNQGYNIATDTFLFSNPIGWEFRLTKGEGGNGVDDNGINGIDDPTEGDGVDNDGNGLIDEGNIVRVRYTSPIDFTPLSTIIYSTRAVNVDSDPNYGTGFYGLSFGVHPTIPNVLEIRLALQARNKEDVVVISRLKTEVAISN